MPDKRKTSLWLITFGLALFAGITLNIQAGEVITNETIKQAFSDTVAFRKSHGVMTENQGRLHNLLNAFLIGDFESIKVLASGVSNSLGRIIAFLSKDDPQAQTEGWQAIAEVSNQAKEIEKSVNEKDLVGAYSHYSQLTFQCIKCHQASRSWGKFPALKQEPSNKKEKQKSGWE